MVNLTYASNVFLIYRWRYEILEKNLNFWFYDSECGLNCDQTRPKHYLYRLRTKNYEGRLFCDSVRPPSPRKYGFCLSLAAKVLQPTVPGPSVSRFSGSGFETLRSGRLRFETFATVRRDGTRLRVGPGFACAQKRLRLGKRNVSHRRRNVCGRIGRCRKRRTKRFAVRAVDGTVTYAAAPPITRRWATVCTENRKPLSVDAHGCR